MINRQHARTRARTFKPPPEHRELKIDPPEGNPLKEEKRDYTHNKKKSRHLPPCTLILRVAFLLLFGACLLLCKMLLLVDLSFLGGVFLMGLRSSSPSAEVPVDGNESRVTEKQGQKEQQEQELVDFPKGWQDYTYDDIRQHFDCRRRSKDNEKPLPSMEDWDLMRETFARVVDEQTPWAEDPVPPTLGYSLVQGIPAPPPYYPKASPGKGRGLFAARDIQKGELVHDGTHSDVVFKDARAWRRFVFSLPPHLSCDCTDWHWMQRLEEGGPYFMLAGLNVSSLMNSGGKEFGPGRSPNALPESSTSGKFYATRDIEKGSEILTDYDSFYTNWEEVGL